MDISYYSEEKVAALEAAFRLVRPEPNWKAAIDKVVDASIAELGDIKEAVTFYTGSVATVTIVGKRPTRKAACLSTTRVVARVQAAGYYAAIGA